MQLPVDDPSHLASAPVADRGPVARRVRRTDLEDLARRLSLPEFGDVVRTGAAVAILADRELKPGTTAYLRHWQRLEAARLTGRIRHRSLPGQRECRYSRSEIEALKRALESEGVTEGHMSRQRAARAVVKRGEALELIDTAAAAKLAGVSVDTARRWGRLGLFGARQIGRAWFFEPELVVGRKPRARREPRVDVTCACCGRKISRSASRVRRARARGAAACHEPQFFCRDCWTTGQALVKRHPGRRGPSKGRAPRISAALRHQWSLGTRDREAAAVRMKRTVQALLGSHERRPTWQETRVQKRWGHGLTASERAEQDKRARSYACRSSARSAKAKQLRAEVAALWRTGLTHEMIGARLTITPRYVRKIAKELELPARRSGRRPRN